MNIEFTPGPWEVGYASPEDMTKSTLAVWQREDLESGFGSPICKVSPELSMNHTDLANATLMAAGPVMLAALQDMCQQFEPTTDAEMAVYAKAQAAMELATTVTVKHDLI